MIFDAQGINLRENLLLLYGSVLYQTSVYQFITCPPCALSGILFSDYFNIVGCLSLVSHRTFPVSDLSVCLSSLCVVPVLLVSLFAP